MTNMKTKKGFARATWALVVTLILAICLSCISMAAEAEPFEQTLHVKQSVTGNALKTKYTYRLTPLNEGPLPAEAGKDAKYYDFEMDGNANVDLKLYFPADVEKDYKYELVRQGEVPAGDTVTPDKHIFGYWVKTDETGKMVIIPYTCYNNEFKISVDEEGNPTDVTLEENKIVGSKGDKGDQGDKGDKGDKGDQGDKGTDGKNGSNGTNGKDGTNGKNGTNGTNGTSTVKTITQTVGKAINTGDPNHILLWGGMALVSAGALIAILIVRRKKEKDEETN